MNMIPKPFIFKATNIDLALHQYNNQMPKHLAEFEEKNGPAQVTIAAVYAVNLEHFIVAVIWQDKIRMEAMAASKKITEGGSDLLNKLSSQLTQALNAEGCQHDEYEYSVDEQGIEKLICKKCGTPLA